jgi:hypothetical protein
MEAMVKLSRRYIPAIKNTISFLKCLTVVNQRKKQRVFFAHPCQKSDANIYTTLNVGSGDASESSITTTLTSV